MAHLRNNQRSPLLLLFALLLTSLFLVQPGSWPAIPVLAQSALPATQDAFVDPNNASTNYNAQRLELAYSNFPTLTGTRRALLQFDLRTVTGSLSTAPLVLTSVENNFPAGATLTLGLYGLADNWTQATVTFATRPPAGAKLQTVTVTAGATGQVRFTAAAVGAYLETQRTGDGIASFLLQIDAGNGTLGLGGNFFFEDREGSSDGLNGNEPAIEAATGSPTNTPTRTATATSTPGVPTATPTPQPPSQTVYYLSSASNGKIAGISYQDEDILRYRQSDGWSLIFDGSDVGLAKHDLDAFHLLSDGSILMSLEKPIVLPALGTVADADILRFLPTSLGSNTGGSFSLYFDGSDVGLTTANEDIDALSLDAQGNLVISTVGTAKVDGVTGQDEDLLTFRATSLGETTAGTWALLLDGSAVNLTAGSEDLSALWIDPAQGNRYLATTGNFSASGSQNSISGDSDDLFGCAPLNASCHFFGVFDGDQVGMKQSIDGVSLDLQGNRFPFPLVTATGDEWPDPVTQFAVLPDAPVEADAEYDEFDQPLEEDTLLNQLFLPLVNR